MNALVESDVRLRLADVPDPEIPVLSVVDLGLVRHVRITEGGTVEVGISPTYSGCPATSFIKSSVEAALRRGGYPAIRVVDVLAPPWTTDWITPEGRRKLREFGIAPPLAGPVSCPRCGSPDTVLLSEFGSTPCKALHRCTRCLEPFDRFKCL